MISCPAKSRISLSSSGKKCGTVLVLKVEKMFKLTKNVPFLAFVFLLGSLNITLVSTEKASAYPTLITTATESDPIPDTLVIPGERVGPITRNTTRQDLAKLFAKELLSDRPVGIGEGATVPGTFVDLGPARSFSVVWADNTRTKAVEVRNLGSDWRTPQGISVSTPLSQLQQKLGKFQFYGFGWDYSGTVLLEGTKLSQYQKTLILRLRTAPAAAKKSPKDYQAVLGDGKFSSNNPKLSSLGITVGEMIVRLAPNKP
jgi:hypothetical protein